ncbi:hypothetical protein GpartN1_g6831.t1 [Galdieria partita]|uniref:Ribosome biogenesis regulatory protein n=1 Tax=Galdieria partita TaxID=83374 RepID=A0A9C7UTY5_9RHOD|nr:hypothetical protein GpartN1_g6831.t1 [Galdieria partita]
MDGVEVDLGSLSCADVRPILQGETKQEQEERILRAVEFLVQGLFTLPEQSSERKSQRELPEPFSVIPRAKPIPKEKPLTKWEQFARIRGIRKRKRDKFAWDETRGEFRPIHGYRSINDESDQVILPHDPSLQPGESPFDRVKEGKRNRVKNNRKSQERNKRSIAKDQLSSRPVRTDKYKSKDLEKSAKIASISTRSLGKYGDRNKPRQKLSSIKASHKKNIIPSGAERERTFQAVNDVLKNF